MVAVTREAMMQVFLGICFGTLMTMFLSFKRDRICAIETIALKLRPKPNTPRKVRTLCLVITSANNLVPKGTPVKETCGTRCDKLIFLRSKADPNFPAIATNTPEGRVALNMISISFLRA